MRQRVPMTSAVRVGGERLYKKAHRGETVETPVRDVEVHRAELLSAADGYAHYEVECTAGTYVRTLVETLGDAYCSDLRRIAIGPFAIEEAGTELPVAAVAGLRPGVAIARGALSDEGDPARGRGAARRATSRSAPSTASTSATRR